MRRRVIRAVTWTALILLLLAWAGSLAITAPWTPWFTIALWTTIGVGLLVRILRGRGRKTAPLDAFHEMNQVYLGRTRTPRIDGTAPESAEIGRPFPDAADSSGRGSATRSE